MTTGAQVVVTVNSSSLNAGSYSGSIKIAAKKGGSVTIPVTLNVTAAAPPSASQTSITSATLTWVANSESDLAGYKVYVGTTPGVYGPSITVGKVTSYAFTSLASGNTYYFAISAYDISGNESALSGVVSKSIY
jgi:fibronectin type 3 domain-containing protein